MKRCRSMSPPAPPSPNPPLSPPPPERCIRRSWHKGNHKAREGIAEWVRR